MSLSSQLRLPNVSTVFLMDLTAGLWVRNWVLHSGNVWKSSTTLPISSVRFDTTTVLSEQTSIANVEANVGSWYHDGNILYVRAPAGQTLFSGTYLARATFRFSNVPKAINSLYYDPRLASVPRLSLRIEPNFGSAQQTGSGSATLLNQDGYFDTLSELQWSAGEVSLKMGVDTASAVMDYSDYAAAGTWIIEQWKLDHKEFSIQLIEKKNGLETVLPLTTYSRENYPEINKDDVGRPIPIAYGKIYGAEPALINVGTKLYKLAGHAIRSIDEIRIRTRDKTQSTDIWTAANPETSDLSLAEFTLGPSWDQGVEVSVDFTGKKDASGLALVNPADILKDIIQTTGVTAIDTASFDSSHAFYDIGTALLGENRTALKPALYLNEGKPAVDFIRKILSDVGGYVYSDLSGQIRFDAFFGEPYDGTTETMQTFGVEDILDETFVLSIDSRPVISSALVTFARRVQDEWNPIATFEDSSVQHANGLLSPASSKVESVLWDSDDANLRAQRQVRFNGPLFLAQFTIPWQAFLTLPSDKIHVVYPRANLDTVLEVIEASYDLTRSTVKLVASNLHGFGDTFGFWREESDPVWNSGGTPANKTAAKQLSGFWTDDNGFAAAADAESFQPSRWS